MRVGCARGRVGVRVCGRMLAREQSHGGNLFAREVWVEGSGLGLGLRVSGRVRVKDRVGVKVRVRFTVRVRARVGGEGAADRTWHSVASPARSSLYASTSSRLASSVSCGLIARAYRMYRCNSAVVYGGCGEWILISETLYI